VRPPFAALLSKSARMSGKMQFSGAVRA